MAFCNNCGNQLVGNERFCARCGAVTSATPAASAPAVTPAVPSASAPSIPVAPPPAVPPPVQPGAPVQYVPAGAVPVAVPVPAPAAKKSGGMLGTVIVIVIAAGIGYYYYNKSHGGANPSATTPPASQPAAPGGQPGSGGSGNAALVKQQTFNAHWQQENGMLVLTTATWANNSNVNLSTAVVQCEQYDASGTDLSQYRVNLDGPVNAGTTGNFSNIQIGAVANGMAKVDCDIVHVKQ